MKKTVFDLSMSQTNIWDLENRYSDTPMNTISSTIEIKGQMNFELLQEALNIILAKDASLRIMISIVDGNPMQCEMPEQKRVFPTYDFSQSDKKAFQKWEQMMAREAISLNDSMLYRFFMFRTGEREGGVLVKMHHIISDGWTQMMLCERIASVYLALLNGEKTNLEESPSYRIHVLSEQEYLSSPSAVRDQEYWAQQLGGDWEPVCFKQERGAASSPLGQRSTFHFSEILGHKMYQFCMERRVSPFLVFYMAFAVYLKRRENLSRFAVGVPVYNRNDRLERETSGMFVSTLPFICGIDENQTVQESLEDIAVEWLEMMRHQKLPFTVISNLASRACADKRRLFYIALSFQECKMVSDHDTRLSFSGNWFYSGYQAEHLCIHLFGTGNQRNYAVNYDYLLQIFSQREIEEFHHSIEGILDEILTYPDKLIADLEVMRPDEKERVLYTFNSTEQFYKKESAYDVFRRMVDKYPERAALICADKKVTYSGLRALAESAASKILAEIREPGPVAVMLPRSTQMMAAMTASMAAGCTWVILPEYLPEFRMEKILQQCGTKAVLTNQEMIGRFPVLNGYTPILMDGYEAWAECWKEQGEVLQAVDSNAPLYLVYTSGSTGEPKGVEVGQAAFLNFVYAMRIYYSQKAVLSLCSAGFDAFLIETMAAFLNGRTVVMAQDAELQNPMRIAALIRQYGVGFLSLTPSRLQAMLSNYEFSQALFCIDRIVCGGEPFPPELMQRLEQYTNARVFNQYGPSEATVGVTIKCMNYANQVTVGAPMPNCKAYVLNRFCKPLPIGAVGNLYLGGTCLANGYKNNEQLTKEKFVPNPFEWQELMYDTGDLASWTQEGEIVLYGRADKQVKVRGQRIELDEIANCIISHPRIEQAYAMVCQFETTEWICLYFTSASAIEEHELRTYTSQRLPGYMIPDYFGQLDCFPVTANGKIDESRLPRPELKSVRKVAENHLQKQLLGIFADSLNGLEMGISDNYFRMGGNSLSAMEVLMNVEEQFGIEIQPAEFYANASVEQMESYLRNKLSLPAEEKEARSLKKAPPADYYPVTPMQQAIFVHSSMAGGEYLYHMPGMLSLKGSIDVQRLNDAFLLLIQSEEILRTGFELTGKGLFQHLHQGCQFEIDEIEADNVEAAAQISLRPFDLKKPPLLHCAVWKDTEGADTVFLDVHHLIGDGLSTPLLLQRLSDYYKDGMGKQSEYSFLDYAYSLSQQKEPVSDYHKQFWKQNLSGDVGKLLLPTDEPRGGGHSFTGRNHMFGLDPKESIAVRNWCNEHELTEYMLFAGGLSLLLSRVSGKNEVMFGTPLSGRCQPETMDICGPFINTLPLRIDTDWGKTSGEYLQGVKDAVLGMIAHQNITLQQLIEMKNMKTNPGENPFFGVLFSMRPLDASQLSFCGQKASFRQIDTDSAKFELALEAGWEQDAYFFRFDYAADLFLPETVAFYGRCLKLLITELTKKPDRTLEQLPLMPDLDYMKLVRQPMYEVMPFVDDMVDRAIEFQCCMQPEQPAIFWHGETVTRDAYWKRALSVASLLQENGIEKGDVVALCMHRTPDMIAAITGILLAGAAYMPILPDYPIKRMLKMYEIADSAFLLCDESSKSNVPNELSDDVLTMPATDGADYFPVYGRNSGDKLCILFTSGSTGEPKGAVLTHRNVNNVFANLKEMFDSLQGNVICTANMIFDTFITESLFALMAGKAIVLADEEEMMLPWAMGSLMERHNVSLLEMTPSRVKACMGNQDFVRALRLLDVFMICGEVLTKEVRDAAYKASGARIINLYGPTETTIYSTWLDHCENKHINVGRPFFNNRAYILDENKNPVMPTSVGEIYMSGAAITDGYMNRPDKTAEAYLPDIFFGSGTMYKTGDLGRLRMDGTIDFCGRIDHQIKLNGQRIELNEISAVLDASGLVNQSAAIPVMDGQRVKAIRVFYVAGSGVVETSDFKRAIEKELPKYMVPSEFIALHSMPLTPTGKTDQVLLRSQNPEDWEQWLYAGEAVEAEEKEESKDCCRDRGDGVALDEKSCEEEACEEEACEEKACEEVCVTKQFSADAARDIWKKVLEKENPDWTISFFDQGGTSLAAMQALNMYYDFGVKMTMEEFFSYPLFSEQMSFLQVAIEKGQEEQSILQEECLAGGDADAVQESEACEETGQPTSRVGLEQVPAENPIAGKNRNQTILVTGATGYLGAHVLYELVEREPAEREIVCLVRKKSLRKVITAWTHYFGQEWTQQALKRIRAEAFDLYDRSLGLKVGTYREFTEHVDEVYHCAADVRHFASDDSILKTNFEGTRNMLQLAKKAGASFYYISTLSVGGSYVRDFPDMHVTFEETDYDIGQNWEDNQYVKSKYLAEGLVREAFKGGLDGKIYRIGCLVGRSDDGTFQLNASTNAFYRIVRGISRLKYGPEYFGRITLDLTPPDVCAKWICELKKSDMKTFHLMGNLMSLEDLAKAINPKISVCQDPDFDSYIQEEMRQTGDQSLMSFYEHMIRFKNQPVMIDPVNEKTEEELKRLGLTMGSADVGVLLKNYLTE